MAWRYLYVDLFVKVHVYECVYRIVLDHLEVKPSGDSHEGAETTAGERRGVRILLRAGLLVSPND